MLDNRGIIRIGEKTNNQCVTKFSLEILVVVHLANFVLHEACLVGNKTNDGLLVNCPTNKAVWIQLCCFILYMQRG